LRYPLLIISFQGSQTWICRRWLRKPKPQSQIQKISRSEGRGSLSKAMTCQGFQQESRPLKRKMRRG
jgi:hypothetical protein